MVTIRNNIINTIETRFKGGVKKLSNSIQAMGDSFSGTSQKSATFNSNLVKAGNGMAFVNKQQDALREASIKYGLEIPRLSNMLRSGQFELVNMTKKSQEGAAGIHLMRREGTKLTAVSRKLGAGFGLATQKFKPFNFHLLGALFLFQQIGQSAGGLFKNSKLLAGIFEAIGTIIQVALLPAFLPFAMLLLDLSIRFLEMNEPARRLIGNLILFVAVVAPIAAFIISLNFAMGALADIFIKIFGFGKLIIGFFSTWGTTILFVAGRLIAVAGIVFTFVSGIKDLFTEGNKVRGVLKLVAVAAGIVAIAMGAPLVVIGVLVGAVGRLIQIWDKMIAAFKSGDGLFQGILGAGKVFFGVGDAPVAAGATGGIVTKPTLSVIGEAGPEAVVPLDQTPGSSPLPGGLGGNININVNAGLGADAIIRMVNEQLSSALRGAGIR